MLQTIFLLGLFVLLGIFVLKMVFGVLGGVVGLAIALIWIAVKVSLLGLLVYIVIRIFSPATARKIRSRLSGNGL